MTTEVAPGLFDHSSLPQADNRHLTPFTTGSWAGMNVVLADGGLTQYPHIADHLGVFYKKREHPIRVLDKLLRGEERMPEPDLRGLSYRVGDLVDSGQRGHSTDKSDKDYVLRLEEELALRGSIDLPKRDGWSLDNLQDYYERLRGIESAILRETVAQLAGAVVAQNEVDQLFVAKGLAKMRSTQWEGYTMEVRQGWLAPLIGLAVDPQVNPFDQIVHDIAPVVGQLNGQNGLLLGSEEGIYTKLKPLRPN